MAVAIAGSPNLTFRATGGATNSPPIPSGSNGEILLLLSVCSGASIPAPSGWNTAFAAVPLDGTWKVWAFWRERDGSEGANVTVDPDAGTSRNTVYALSGCNTNRPVGAYQTRVLKTASLNMPAPGIWLPPDCGCIYIGFGVNSYNSASEDPSTLSGDTGVTWSFTGDHTSPGADGWQHQFVANNSTGRTLNEKTSTITGGTAALNSGICIVLAATGIEDVLITTTGTGNITAPAGASAVRMQCTGGGGTGGTSTSAEAGGGGGAFSETTSIAVTGGSSIVYYDVSAGGVSASDTWARVGTNSAPASTTDGCLADSGTHGSGQTAGPAGTAANSIGNTKFDGGAGAAGQGGGGSRAGSGGGGAGGLGNAGNTGNAGSGSTAGNGGNPGNPQGGQGGNGGASGATGAAGEAPGGGGGGGGNSGGNAGAGARGQVRLIFTLSGPAIGRADETDTAYNRGLVAGHGQSNETDTASKPGGPVVVLPVNRPIETDTAFNRGVVLQPQRANETDSAFALSQGVIQVPVGMATETDTAFKAGGIGMAPNRPIETDTAFQRSINLSFVRANETDTAFARPQQGGIGVAIETDTALRLGTGIAPQRANETDTASALQLILSGAVGRANETDTANALVYGVPVARANEADTAFARVAVFIRSAGQANDTETAFARTAVVIRPVGFVSEADSAFRTGVGLSIGRANEADSAFARNALITVDHGFSIEIDSAFQMFGALVAGSGRKPYVKGNQGILRDRRQPVHKTL